MTSTQTPSDDARHHVLEALRGVREAVNALCFPFPLLHTKIGRALSEGTVRQLSDYLIPRYSALDAPLLAVVGGSTGAGKSSIINALVRKDVTAASTIRPTTRRPTLVYHPNDEHWFAADRILPHLARVHDETHIHDESKLEQGTRELSLVPNSEIPLGLALLDSPDIDSVAQENRDLANELLAAGDLWIFVTTAARYADAVPWEFLQNAAKRNTVTAVVLNRVSADAQADVYADLARKLRERGLSQAPLFVIAEQTIQAHAHEREEQMLYTSSAAVSAIPESAVEPLKQWIEDVASDTAARCEIAKTTLHGAMNALQADSALIIEAYQEQLETIHYAQDIINTATNEARTSMKHHSSDGTLLKGELLGRWQDIVGTGAWTRKLESGISLLRDRVVVFFRGKPPEDVQKAHQAIEEGIYALIEAELESAAEKICTEWERRPELVDCAEKAKDRIRSHEDRSHSIHRLVRDWQAHTVAILQAEGASKKSTARLLSFGVNIIGVALMIAVFANTGGLVAGEIAVAGGTAVAAQKVLEAVFGDDAIRRMTARVKKDLMNRIDSQIKAEKESFDTVLAAMHVTDKAMLDVKQAYAQLKGADRVW